MHPEMVTISSKSAPWHSHITSPNAPSLKEEFNQFDRVVTFRQADRIAPLYKHQRSWTYLESR